MGVRIFTLAKELGRSSKDLIAYLETQGIAVKSHMSTIEDPVANILRERMKPKAPKAPKVSPAGRPGAGRPGAGRSGPGRSGDGQARGGSGVAAGNGSPGSAPARTGSGRGGSRPAGRGDAGSGRSQGGGGGRDNRRVRIFVQDGGGGDDYRGRGKRGGRRKREAAVVERPKEVEVLLPTTVKELSALTTIKVAQIVSTLFKEGHMAQINSFLDEEMIGLVCVEFDIDFTFKKREEDADDFVKAIEDREDSEEDLVARAPVVTFMGHVDHGKTSLLDKIRSSTVTTKEAGGITQHLGAYRVDKENAHVVFIDTPGHKAFTEMRSRGATVTDVAVLIVAADDGVKPQTEEAYSHAKAAGVPVIVALNKIDKEGSNPMRAMQQLAELGLQTTEWGGDTEIVQVSAMTGQGIEDLLEILSLTSEILELKANPNRPAVGTVLEAAATQSRGVVATLLVQTGTLRQGDHVVCGSAFGRVRGMAVNGLTNVTEAGPSTPVQLTGLNSAPLAGEKLYAVADAQKAREIAEERARREREKERFSRAAPTVTLENMFEQLAEKDKLQELNLILRADVRGSAEALRSSLEELSTDEVRVRILHAGVGAITQDDVSLADASDAIVIGFHVGPDDRARSLADERGVELRLYNVIYEAIDEVKMAMESRLAPEFEEQVRGHAEIRAIYKASRIGNIAGCYVTGGTISRNDRVRVMRDGRVIHTGELGSLKRFKDDAKEVKENYECGIKVAKYDDIKVGDTLEAFALVQKQRTI